MAPPPKHLGIASQHDVDRLDADRLLERVEMLSASVQEQRAYIAARNERWYHGEQFDAADWGEDSAFGEWDEELPKLEDNLLPNLVDHAVATVLDMAPVTVWYPRKGSDGSMLVAAAANRVMEHYLESLDLHHLNLKTLRLAFLHGSAGQKPYWNPYRGAFTEATDPEGDISIDAVTVFEYATDGAEDVERSKWVYFRREIDVHDGLAMLLEAGYSKEDARKATIAAESSDDEDDYGLVEEKHGWKGLFGPEGRVRACEIWWLPGAMIKRGRFVSYVGGKVVSNMEYPYDHRQTPLCVCKWRPRRGSPHGSTPMDSMVAIQSSHNQGLSVLSSRIRAFRNNYVWGAAATIKQMAKGDLFVSKVDENEEKPEIINAEPDSEQVDRFLALTEQQMIKAVGIPQMLQSGDNFNASTAGKSMAYLDETTGRKFIFPLRSVMAMIARRDRQIIELCQQHFTLERMVRLLGPGTELQAELFLKANLSGYVLLPQVGAGAQVSRAARGAEALDRGAAGVMDPARAAEIGATGLPETEDESWHAQQVHEAAALVLRGEPGRVPDNVDAGIALRELRRLASAYADVQGVDGVWQMIRYFESELAGGTNAPPPAPPAPNDPAAPGAGLTEEMIQ